MVIIPAYHSGFKPGIFCFWQTAGVNIIKLVLIVTRKRNEKILIGDTIVVRVVAVHHEVVELEVADLNKEVKRETVKFDEEIQINEGIKVKVTDIITGSRIRLGITAPRELKILRIPKVSEKNEL